MIPMICSDENQSWISFESAVDNNFARSHSVTLFKISFPVWESHSSQRSNSIIALSSDE